MENILLQIPSDTTSISTLASNPTIFTSFWFWASLIEFVVIILLLVKLKKRNPNLAFAELTKDKMKNAKDTNINMDNLMNSINGSRDLYKELSRLCHPDRFVNKPEQKIAEEIFQEISRHKRNHGKLTELKERAKTELNINL